MHHAAKSRSSRQFRVVDGHPGKTAAMGTHTGLGASATLPPADMVNPKLWPNLLSATRIALMPAVLTAAIAGSRLWFVVLLTLSLVTDALDGFLARRLNAFSEFGRKLDSAADYLVVLAAIAGIALLWSDIVRRELVWIACGLAAFFAVIVYG